MNQIYDPQGEHDACGVGMVANLDAIPKASTVSDALTILENLEHRGATGSDPDSGDGAGILLQLPHSFLDAVTSDLGISLPGRGLYGVGQWMLPCQAGDRSASDYREGLRRYRPEDTGLARSPGGLIDSRWRLKGKRADPCDAIRRR